MFKPDVRFHVVPPGERLLAKRAQIRLRTMDDRVMPPVTDRFATVFATVQWRRVRYFVEHIDVVPGRISVFQCIVRPRRW